MDHPSTSDSPDADPDPGSPGTPDAEGAPCEQEPALSGDLLIELDNQVETFPDQQAHWLLRYLQQLAHLAGVQHAQISIAVVDDAVMADLHEQYTDVPGTTDVLTFDLRDDPGDPIEAELVLCYDEAARQAADRGHDVQAELLLYAVHGLLHLLGYDDHDPEQAERMHRKEDELLVAAGLGPIYGRASARHAADETRRCDP